MAGLQDRIKKEKMVSPTEKVIEQITSNTSKTKKEKYFVNVGFDGDHEEYIRAAAKLMGVGVATYIKMCTIKDYKERLEQDN